MEPNIQTTRREQLPAKNNITSKVISKYEGEIQTFPNIQKLRELITRRVSLQEILKEVIVAEAKNKRS